MNVESHPIPFADRSRAPTPARLAAWTWGTPVRRCMTVVAAWRLLIALATVAAHFVMPHGKFTAFSLFHHGWPVNPFTLAIDGGVRNDALWYARIAQHGYTYSTHYQSSIAFYPLYPLLIKIGSLLTGNAYVAGMLISAVCLFGAAAALCAWLENRGLARHAPLVTAVLLCFPWAVFYAAMYTESLYLLLALGAFTAYERSRWSTAAVCVSLLVLSRPQGILILPCLAVLAPRSRQWQWRALTPFVAGAAALAGFAIYQYAAFGTPIATIRAAAVPPWSRSLSRAALDITLHGRPGLPPWYLAVMFIIGILFLAAIPVVYRRFGPAYALFAALSIIAPAASGLISLDRYAIVDFPVFAVLACTHNRRVLVGYFTFSFYCLLFLVGAFTAGWGIF